MINGMHISKKQSGEKKFFPTKVKQDPTHRSATRVKWLRSIFFALRRSTSLSSEAQAVGVPAHSGAVKKESGVAAPTHTHLHVSWIPLTLTSASTSEDRAAAFYLARAVMLQSYCRGKTNAGR